jgi:hypothetical protein
MAITFIDQPASAADWEGVKPDAAKVRRLMRLSKTKS